MLDQRGVTHFCQLCVFKLLQLAQEAQIGPRTRPSRSHRRQRLHPAVPRHRHDVSHHQSYTAGHSCNTESAEHHIMMLVDHHTFRFSNLVYKEVKPLFFLKLWLNDDSAS